MDELEETKFLVTLTKLQATVGDLSRNFDHWQSHVDARFDETHRLLLQVQSDLRMFYRELGYQDSRLDTHDVRLDNLEGKS